MIEQPKPLLTARQIEARIPMIAREIDRHYDGERLVILSLLKGSVVFLADLIRQLRTPFDLEFALVQSYHAGTESGSFEMHPLPMGSLEDRHILVVDDILDTGITMARMRQWLLDHEVLSVRSCVLLDKKARRQEEVRADFFGFEIPDVFVVGYGMDMGGQWRNLPYIGQLS